MAISLCRISCSTHQSHSITHPQEQHSHRAQDTGYDIVHAANQGKENGQKKEERVNIDDDQLRVFPSPQGNTHKHTATQQHIAASHSTYHRHG